MRLRIQVVRLTLTCSKLAAARSISQPFISMQSIVNLTFSPVRWENWTTSVL
jgi:hypothetical protein